MSTPVEFTGERFLPECTGEIWAEHWHRYLFAANFVAGKTVLDAASGEGYGSAWLARNAAHVTGLDVDPNTVTLAGEKYKGPNLRFELGSVTAMPFPDASFDCAVSFETLEHLAEQESMLAELRRVVRPDGMLIISTPNRIEYSDRRQFQNEFHVRELYEEEFRALVSKYFTAQSWYGQKLLFNSAIWPEPKWAATNAQWLAMRSSDREMPVPMYFIVIAAQSETNIPSASDATLLADPAEAMYQDYTNTVSRITRLEQISENSQKLVAERDRMIELRDERLNSVLDLVAERDRQLSDQSARAEMMEQLIVERDALLEATNRRVDALERLTGERDRQLAETNDRALALEQLTAARERIVVERDAQLAAVNARIAGAERLLAERERIIVERDAQLAMLNEHRAFAEGLVAERERIIVERDAQLADAIADLAARAERIAALEAELIRRTGWRWWVALPYRRLRRVRDPVNPATGNSGP